MGMGASEVGRGILPMSESGEEGLFFGRGRNGYGNGYDPGTEIFLFIIIRILSLTSNFYFTDNMRYPSTHPHPSQTQAPTLNPFLPEPGPANRVMQDASIRKDRNGFGRDEGRGRDRSSQDSRTPLIPNVTITEPRISQETSQTQARTASTSRTVARSATSLSPSASASQVRALPATSEVEVEADEYETESTTTSTTRTTGAPMQARLETPSSSSSNIVVSGSQSQSQSQSQSPLTTMTPTNPNSMSHLNTTGSSYSESDSGVNAIPFGSSSRSGYRSGSAVADSEPPPSYAL